MLYEMRTYALRPRSLPEVLERFGEAYPYRRPFSEMAGLWYGEIGPLNRIVHIWPYESLAERERIRAAAAAEPRWPPRLREFIVRMEVELYTPLAFSPLLAPGDFGPCYELRRYQMKTEGGRRLVEAGWPPLLEKRRALSPLAVAMVTEIGPLNRFVHIWPYRSLEQRAEVRRKSVETGLWPPPGIEDAYDAMENAILLPAPFSPMQ
jgi:hypothetical protein